MNKLIYLFVIGVCFLFSAMAISADGEPGQLPVVNGEHWTAASDAEKLSFLMGMGTILEVEEEFQAENEQPPGVSAVPILLEGLGNFTLTEIMQGVDSWYAANAEKIKRPVIEVLWFEMALPNLPAKPSAN